MANIERVERLKKIQYLPMFFKVFINFHFDEAARCRGVIYMYVDWSETFW